jgi:hypothetical protein
MRENANGVSDRWKFIVARKRDKYFVTDAADIDNRLRGQSAYQFAFEKCDHGCAAPRRVKSLNR